MDQEVGSQVLVSQGLEFQGLGSQALQVYQVCQVYQACQVSWAICICVCVKGRGDNWMVR